MLCIASISLMIPRLNRIIMSFDYVFCIFVIIWNFTVHAVAIFSLNEKTSILTGSNFTIFWSASKCSCSFSRVF